MAVVVVFNLIIVFTILTAILLVALLVYAILFYLKRRRVRQGANRGSEEAGYHAQADVLSRRQSQRQVQQVIYSEEQRMSTKMPPLQLLPEIETSDDKAIEWLEKGRCKEVRFEDGRLEYGARAYQVLGAKKGEDFDWDWASKQAERTTSTP